MRSKRGLQTTAGFCSAFLVASIGVGLSVYSLDPMFALTTAWAMDAVAHRALHKATMMPTAGDKRAVSADVHESLAVESAGRGGEVRLSGCRVDARVADVHIIFFFVFFCVV